MSVRHETFTPEQKVEMVIGFLKSAKSLAEYCRLHGIPEPEFKRWRKRFLKGARDCLRYGESGVDRYLQRIQYLEAKIERLELDNIALRAQIRFLKGQ